MGGLLGSLKGQLGKSRIQISRPRCLTWARVRIWSSRAEGNSSLAIMLVLPSKRLLTTTFWLHMVSCSLRIRIWACRELMIRRSHLLIDSNPKYFKVTTPEIFILSSGSQLVVESSLRLLMKWFMATPKRTYQWPILRTRYQTLTHSERSETRSCISLTQPGPRPWSKWRKGTAKRSWGSSSSRHQCRTTSGATAAYPTLLLKSWHKSAYNGRGWWPSRTQ